MDELSAAELDEFARQLYAAFDTGWNFEEFIKLLFIAMGLDDVTVTSRTRDGGIDLTALRRGVEGLSSMDEVQYVAQAKRYKLDTPAKLVDIRALRGVMPSSSKGIFVATGRYTKDAREFAKADPSRPILLLDGRAVVQLCIDHGLGFRSRPVFDPSRLRGQLGGASSGPSALPPQSVHDLRVMRTITANDIRARIIRVQAEIAAEMDTSDGRLSVAFPPTVECRDYAYRADARFITGVTDVLRAFGLLLQDGERVPKLGEWVLNRETQEVDVYVRHGIAPKGGSA